jgi:hypothetical protein
MERRKSFEPGDMVATYTGQAGMVISEHVYAKVRHTLKEGKRPGYYFAPGCCQNPDYVIQVPVLFEDGMYDVMRAMHIRRAPGLGEEKKALIKQIIDDNCG